ncbi:response regulator receiver protein [Haladaptatus paucihalophilus DX253]|uniref:DNA-binding response regulator, OmpR family, contains REC and winged-helix (WHTH) domain n=1 Tax=Haladaptatus paucihalophilus DX253 TaxID=797209 RepID=E7QTC2_HALPU|nr:response regulator [Haladaptatus paucihalophilus]EFW91851.1 response regulator receiver protein [Haladaptatus paucihalophilus DX253]SHK81146.1 DNA-binding response regulator, OmpR family, contains REC and winged-helix (wHTH) domain [Haladaptatus paucihalophilus DX253]
MSEYQILVVDDEQPIADLFTRWLEDEYDVRTAYSGAEAIAMLDDSPDIVLLDRDMPETSGDDVLEAIRARNIDCRVGMVTAVEPDFDVLELGYDAYVVKPITEPDELYDVVESLRRRATYSTDVQQLLVLSSKRATLEARIAETELARHEEYKTLVSEIRRLKRSLSTTLDGMDDAELDKELTDSRVAPEQT